MKAGAHFDRSDFYRREENRSESRSLVRSILRCQVQSMPGDIGRNSRVMAKSTGNAKA
jgi:hypothetical protein